MKACFFESVRTLLFRLLFREGGLKASDLTSRGPTSKTRSFGFFPAGGQLRFPAALTGLGALSARDSFRRGRPVFAFLRSAFKSV